MRIVKNLLLAGAAALTLAGGARLALAQPLHKMTVRLPDGGVALIRYSGNVRPRVAFVPAPQAASYYHRASPFAMLDRISAQMNREMDALMRDVDIAPPLVDANGTLDVSTRNLPASTMQYSVFSTMAGDGHFCTRSVEIIRAARGAPARVVKKMSGDCDGVGNVQFGVAPVAPHYRAAPLIATRDWQPPQYSGPTPLNVAYQPTR